MLKKGLLIAFVGIDGAGKTTHSKLLFKHIKNYTTQLELIKAYSSHDSSVLNKYKNQWDDVSLTLFFQMLHRFQSSRAKKVIDNNGVVIADKWNEAYFAYHNHFGFLSKDSKLRKSLDVVTFSERKPDICFYMRVSPQIVKERLNARKIKKMSDINALENVEKLVSFFEREAKRNKWIVIEGSNSIKENSAFIKKYTEDYISSL